MMLNNDHNLGPELCKAHMLPTGLLFGAFISHSLAQKTISPYLFHDLSQS